MDNTQCPPVKAGRQKTWVKNMIKRKLADAIKQHIEWFPVVHLNGPRQSGKTTLLEMVFPDSPSANLEDPSTLEMLLSDPRGVIDSMMKKGTPVVFDEAQRCPELFSWIQVVSDEKKQNGLFILTGSQNFLLNDQISQSLAGRTSILTLLPLSFQEVAPALNEIDHRILKGGYPRLYDDQRPAPPTDILYENYIATYLERDVRRLTSVQDLATFHRFLRLCAMRTGQLLNKANLAVETGISQPSVERWLSVLEASNVIYRLQPFHANLNKRLVKSPKLYFCDTGLACHLAGIHTVELLETHPLRGALFENMVFIELVKHAYNQGHSPKIHFYRDKGGHEVDFLIGEDRSVDIVEVKAGKTFRSEYLSGIHYLRKLLGKNVKSARLLYAGDTESKETDIVIQNIVSYF